jgi:peptide/nickel transport system substrate-binding protein
MKIRLIFAAVLLAGSVVVAAEQPRAGGQLTLALSAEPKTLDPLKAADEPSGVVRYLTGGVLIRLNRQTQKLEPELALSWSSPDAKHMSLRLRPGLAFSDGSAFRAKDVCAMITRLMDPAVDSPFADNFEVSKGKTLCQADGDYGVQLTFPVALSAAERLFDDIPVQSANGAVLGPFFVAAHQAGSFLLLARNPNYWKRDERGTRLPYLDSIRLEVQRNRDLELLRFRKGEFQIVNGLDPELFDRVKAETPAMVRDLGVSLDSEQLWFNQVPTAPIPQNKKDWFASREFRVAISTTIQRADLARVVYHGYASPPNGPVSPANKLWWNSSLPELPTNPAAALDGLKKAGFQLKDGVLRDKTGQPVEFSIITNAGNKSRERMAAMIQQDVKALGIRVTVVTLDFPSLIERITSNYNYEACLLGQISTDIDPNGQSHVWMSASANHQWNPNQKAPATAWEAEIDKLMSAQSSTADPAKRKAAFDQVQKIVVEQAPFIYLTNRHNLVGVSPAVGNFNPSTLWPQTLWNADRLYLKEPLKVASE